MRRILAVDALFLLIFCCHVAAAKDAFTGRSLSSCAAFPQVTAIGDAFREMAADYPEIARALEIGTSAEGRVLHALRLSADPDEETVEPEVRLIGAIHGNECMGVEICMLAAERFVSEYGEDPFVTRLLDNAELVVIPLVNPDGYSASSASRSNSNGVDLNRNFYFAWTEGGGPAPFSEPETRALRDFSDDNAFNLGISYHTVSYYVNAAWNYTPHHPPDEALIEAIGEAYAGSSVYRPVFGWDWYNIQGDVNDWSLGTAGTFDWTLELTSDTESRWDINGAGLEAFLSFVFQGIQGTVTDAADGTPLRARISVMPEGAPIFTDADVGDYNRLLLPGSYTVTAHAQGYAPATVENVVVAPDAMTRADFALVRDDEAPIFAFRTTGMSLPQPIPTGAYNAVNPYLNETRVWDALGEPDGRPYCLSADPDRAEPPPLDLTVPVGSITVDFGDAPAVDKAGADLRLVSAVSVGASVAVLGATDRDGPFVLLAEGSDTFDVDLFAAGMERVRYIRVVDLGTGPFNVPCSGYGLDAVVNLSAGGAPPPDGGPNPDDGGEGDTEDGGFGDADADCGCVAAGGRASTGLMEAVRFLLK